MATARSARGRQFAVSTRNRRISPRPLAAMVEGQCNRLAPPHPFPEGEDDREREQAEKMRADRKHHRLVRQGVR